MTDYTSLLDTLDDVLAQHVAEHITLIILTTGGEEITLECAVSMEQGHYASLETVH